MSEQRQAMPRIVQRVADCGLKTGLILGGSVRHGYERTDSDLDFFAIAERGLDQALQEFALVSEKNGCQVLQSQQDGFVVHIAYWTTESFNDLLNTIPYMTYPLLDGEIVHDPACLAERCRDRINQYFEAHPTLRQAWIYQLADVRRFKMGSLSSLDFPAWSDFNRNLERILAKEMAEQGAPTDMDNPRG